MSPPSLLRAERIAIATPSRGLFEFPVVVSMRKGFYKSEGLRKILELERPLNASILIEYRPFGRIAMILLHLL